MKKRLSLLLLVVAAMMITACGTHYPPVFDSGRTSVIFSFDSPALSVTK